MNNPVDQLKEALQLAGVNCDNVSLSRNGDPLAHNRLAPSTYHFRNRMTIRVDWPNGEAPTQQQRNGADAVIQAFDFSNRIPKQLASLIQEWNNVSSNDFKKALCYILASETIVNPRFPRKLNIPIDGDEPEE